MPTDTPLQPKYCAFCGAPVCRRLDDPFCIPFLFCHHCGAPATCPPRPAHSVVTQTPLEWAAFSSSSSRDVVLDDFLSAFSERAMASMKSMDAKDDVDGQFSMSPQSTRKHLLSVVSSHEETILHLKRVHEAEVRKLRSQLAVAEALNVQQQREVARLEGLNAAARQEAQQLSESIEEARVAASAETERKWRLLMERESTLRAERVREVASAWRLLANAALPTVS